jgi:hypothetical protein
MQQKKLDMELEDIFGPFFAFCFSSSLKRLLIYSSINK